MKKWLKADEIRDQGTVHVSRINRIEAKGRCEKHLPFAVYNG